MYNKGGRNGLKIYIAGKITNNPDYQREFEQVEHELIDAGNLVMNPARLPQGFEQRIYWNICKAMIDACDMVLFLPNWTDSKGSHFEMGYCEGTNKQYQFYERRADNDRIV
jgi:nucleoside 2-deoxyribosyltransferase